MQVLSIDKKTKSLKGFIQVTSIDEDRRKTEILINVNEIAILQEEQAGSIIYVRNRGGYCCVESFDDVRQFMVTALSDGLTRPITADEELDEPIFIEEDAPKIKPIEVIIPTELDCIQFRLAWCEYKLYLATEHNIIVRSRREVAMLRRLNKISGGDLTMAIEMLEYFINNKFKSMFNIQKHKERMALTPLTRAEFEAGEKFYFNNENPINIGTHIESYSVKVDTLVKYIEDKTGSVVCMIQRVEDDGFTFIKYTFGIPSEGKVLFENCIKTT